MRRSSDQLKMTLCLAVFAVLVAAFAVCDNDGHSPIPSPSGSTSATIGVDPAEQRWLEIPESHIRILDGDSSIPAKIKIRRDSDNYFVLVKFPADSERLQHRPWHWDPPNQIYVSGDEKEEALCLILSDSRNPSGGSYDLWIWRSARTNPTGFAEDHHSFTESIGRTGTGSAARTVRLDAGTPPWESRFFAKFAGETIPRFHNRAPTGSAADVRARGRWRDGSWTIEFSRKADTGNPDDIPLENADLVIVRGAPDLNALDIRDMDRFPLRPATGSTNETN